MADNKKRIKSAVMMVEYQVVRPKSSASKADIAIELPNINHVSTPRTDVVVHTGGINRDFNFNEQTIIKPLAKMNMKRRNSRQDEIVQSMFDQISELKVPLRAGSAASNHDAMIMPRSASRNSKRRMSVQEKLIIVKQKVLPSRTQSSPMLLLRRQSEPAINFARGAPQTLRSDGETTNTTESSAGQELVLYKDSKIKEEKDEEVPEEPELNFSIEKCKSWIKDLPDKFSGLNVLTFPEIQSQPSNK